MKRTCYNTELSIKNVGETVCLVGWVAKRRNLGNLYFVDLRDRSGIIQLLLSNDLNIDIRNEYVIAIKGIVRKKDIPNPNLKTGDIEVFVKDITILNEAVTTPLIIDNVTDALEEVRLKYRYLDIRRPNVQKTLITRANTVTSIRNYLNAEGYIDVETPILTKSTPGGARDYLVPSRLHEEAFYALPQSPQIYKQLLMIGGIEKYYQIAKCFRDEDLRSDRQPEFTQLDIEASFVTKDDVLTMTEGLLKKVFKEIVNYDVELPLRRIQYSEAIDKYGSDKPDTRFSMVLTDLKHIMSKSSFEPFQAISTIKGIKVAGVADNTSRKAIDTLQLEAKKFGLNGATVLKYEGGVLNGSFAKFLNDEICKQLITVFELHENDILIIAASNEYKDVCSFLGATRCNYARQLQLIESNTYDLLWVVDFPLFERSKESGRITSSHHPFTKPLTECDNIKDLDPENILADAYDIIINGYEVGGGSIRIHKQELQQNIFEILQLSQEEINSKFGFFIDAFKYGTPPHGGIALGLDRLIMILTNTSSITDVIAFPKNLSAVCPMMHNPCKVEQVQLDDLNIKFKK